LAYGRATEEEKDFGALPRLNNRSDEMAGVPMNQNELVESWKREEQQPFFGWDFSYLDGRMLEEQAPWSFSSQAAELMRQSSSVVDLGTGGGERFLRLRKYWPKKVVVTEDYPPNFRLATERLTPLGVKVVKVPLTDYDPMPFADGEFDLVMNRHSGFNSSEVARVLARGGTFLTQQVHGLWAYDLLAAFDAKPQWPTSTVEKYVPRLKAAGLTIVNTQEWSGQLAFADVAAIVYYLKAVPWLVPGFSVETHSSYLLKLQSRLEKGETLAFVARKYLIEARKVELA
jgi:SAM-dependent methyltransferase